MTNGRSEGSGRAASRISGEAVRRATGRDREAWLTLLDAWGAGGRAHREIAAWLAHEHGVDGWWAQMLTVEYEQARGMRVPGGARDGTFAVGASATVAVPVERLFRAFVDGETRERWLPGAALRERTSQPGRSARFDWESGSTRVSAIFSPRGDTKSHVAVQHERLPHGRAAEERRAFWRERLAALKALLEG